MSGITFIPVADSLQMSISNWESSGRGKDIAVEQRGNRQRNTRRTAAHLSGSRLKYADTLTCALLCVRLVLAVVAGLLFRLVSAAGGVGFERPGDSRDVRQGGRRARQRGRPALQEELPVVDDSGPCRRQQLFVNIEPRQTVNRHTAAAKF